MRLRLIQCCTFMAATALVIPTMIDAQDAARKVEGGGVLVPGWTGVIDANETKQGQKLENAKLAQEGKDLKVTTAEELPPAEPIDRVPRVLRQANLMGLPEEATAGEPDLT